ncbi:hypothetical protein Tco_0544869 [Tanacetum coccineum]
MVAVVVPQTLEYKGGQLNAAPVLEVENFTNWKKRFMCHIIGIEPQFENIIKNSPFIPMDFHDSPDDEEDTKSSQEYMNDLQEEYQARALLAKSKRFFKMGVSITGSNKPKLSEVEDSTLSNHDTGKVPSNESQRNITDHSVVVFKSPVTNYDSADESSVCSTPFLH